MKKDNNISIRYDFSLRKKDHHRFWTAIIITVIVIISLASISIGIYAYNAIKNLVNYTQELPCEELPEIETVRQVVEDHKDIIEEIENTSPGNVWVEINERCNGKGELFIYYDTVYTKDKILEIVGGDTFFGVPYRLFNV
ncbi:MAG: hypothetical protein ACFFB0_18525 [Promethearchaeota archaeon]